MRIANKASKIKRKEELKYILELDADYITELITEHFDDALDLMSPHSWVYGGAIRDALAGLPLLGDLDLTTIAEDTILYKNFQESTKWAEIDPKPKFINRKGPSGAGKSEITNPIGGLFRFKNVSERIVDVILSSGHDANPAERALFPARSVDFICCGAVMDVNGRVYEVVPEALQDCKNRVLRYNPACANADEEGLVQRIKMLEKRGWKSEINIKKALTTAKANFKKAKRLEEARKSAVKIGKQHTLVTRLSGADSSAPGP